MDDQNRNFNKFSNLNNCLDIVAAMWETFLFALKQVEMITEIKNSFAKKYMCV